MKMSHPIALAALLQDVERADRRIPSPAMQAFYWYTLGQPPRGWR